MKQKGVGKFFLDEVGINKPKVFLEVGVFHGVTARNVCELLSKFHGEDFKYVGIDLFDENSENKDEVIPNTKFSNPFKNIYFNYIKKQNPYSLEAVEDLLKKFKNNITLIKGTGDNGRIIKRDIDSYKPSNYGHFTQPKPHVKESSYEIPNNTMRKAIAKRLSDSKFSAPHYYLNIEMEMDNMISFRQQFINTQNIKISFNDIIAKAVALSLAKHPKVNSRWYDDKILFSEHVHLGVAVAVEDGLVVPVVKFANSKDLPEINSEIKDFAERAKNKKLNPSEIEGSTFTISNLGMFGIESFTSIINQPNSAILSIGAIIQKPIVKNSEIVVGNTMKLTLACDHRTVDGATGSLFLKTLKDYIENPVSILI